MTHIFIGIQTKGFKAFKGDNLTINIGFLGKVSNNLKHRYKIKIDGVAKVLTSKKICLLKPSKFSLEELAGLPWNLELFSQNSTIVPQESIIYKDTNDKYNVRFYNYQQRNNSEESDEDRPSTFI